VVNADSGDHFIHSNGIYVVGAIRILTIRWHLVVLQLSGFGISTMIGVSPKERIKMKEEISIQNKIAARDYAAHCLAHVSSKKPLSFRIACAALSHRMRKEALELIEKSKLKG